MATYFGVVCGRDINLPVLRSVMTYKRIVISLLLGLCCAFGAAMFCFSAAMFCFGNFHLWPLAVYPMDIPAPQS